MSVSLSSRRPTCIPGGLPLLPSPILVETPTRDFITAPQTLIVLYPARAHIQVRMVAMVTHINAHRHERCR